MAKVPPREPKYRHYKPKNLAVVRIAGCDHYLGKRGSPESHERYDRLIAEWRVGRHQILAANASVSGSPDAGPITVKAWFWTFGDMPKNGTSRTAGLRARSAASRRPCPRQAALRLRACHQVRPAGLDCLPPKTDRGRDLPQANQPARRPYPPDVKWGVAREMVPETVWRAVCALCRAYATAKPPKGRRYGLFPTNASPPSSPSSRPGPGHDQFANMVGMPSR